MSSLKTYTRCGHQWYLERFHKPKPPRSPAAWTARGIAAHETILEWEKSDRQIDAEKYFVDAYDQCIDKFTEEQPDYSLWTTTPGVKYVKKDIASRRDDGLGQIQQYIDYALNSVWEVYRGEDGELWAEKSFEVELRKFVPGVYDTQGTEDPWDILPLRGSIDLVLEWPDGSLTARDAKTGNPERDNRQIRTYGFVLQEHFRLEVLKGDYYYTKLNREKKPYGSSGLINLDASRAYITKMYFDLSDGIQERKFQPNPSNDNCKFCPMADYGLCPEGAQKK